MVFAINFDFNVPLLHQCRIAPALVTEVYVFNAGCFQINRSEVPEILPHPTYDLYEGYINDMIKILYSLQTDVGLSETQRKEKLILICGDLMTVLNIRYNEVCLGLTY